VPDVIDVLDVDHVFCGGDLVGYGSKPSEVCDLIEQRRIPTIYGNYDFAIGRDLHDCGCAYRDQHDRDLGQLSVEWTLAHTNQASKDFMRELPFDIRFEMGPTEVRLVHGSPRKVNEYLFEDKPAKTFERIAALADCDVLVFGHTHQPWIHEYGGVESSTVAPWESPRTVIRERRSLYWNCTRTQWFPPSGGLRTTSKQLLTRSRKWDFPGNTQRNSWPRPDQLRGEGARERSTPSGTGHGRLAGHPRTERVQAIDIVESFEVAPV
jgi:predicted phosphodiesterase